ncbi:hypothetical protein OG21DRAFT_533105 [Imleria badia]|nr:hypothetical protein OG21DRAFT_533105 [Imleria badia]
MHWIDLCTEKTVYVVKLDVLILILMIMSRRRADRLLKLLMNMFFSHRPAQPATPTRHPMTLQWQMLMGPIHGTRGFEGILSVTPKHARLTTIFFFLRVQISGGFTSTYCGRQRGRHLPQRNSRDREEN